MKKLFKLLQEAGVDFENDSEGGELYFSSSGIGHYDPEADEEKEEVEDHDSDDSDDSNEPKSLEDIKQSILNDLDNILKKDGPKDSETESENADIEDLDLDDVDSDEGDSDEFDFNAFDDNEGEK